jgi:hypothetical protein
MSARPAARRPGHLPARDRVHDDRLLPRPTVADGHDPATPPRVVNPRTKETFVLLRVDEYERLKEDEYDDSPWTRAELQALAWEVAERTGWDEYDDTPEQP